MPPTSPSPGVFETLRRDVRVPTHAIPDAGHFDPTRLPHHWMDERLRLPGLISTLLGGCSAMFGLVILWESKAGSPPLHMVTIPGVAWGAGAIGAVLLFLGVWVLARRDFVVIDQQGVKVREYRLGSGLSWELPLSAYRGMALIRCESVIEGDPAATWTTWAVTLHHEEPARSVLLYRRMVLDQEGQVFDHYNRLTPEGASTCEVRATANGSSWAEAMGIPLLVERDGELVEEAEEPPKLWLPM